MKDSAYAAQNFASVEIQTLIKKFHKYLDLIFKDLCTKHNTKGVSAYALLKVILIKEEFFNSEPN
jgi:hypothetical protein